jgi:hypothetical protein
VVAPSAHGFTGPGWREFYRVVLPFRGRDKRLFFNRISEVYVTIGGLSAALIGYGAGGLLGSVLGLGLGVTSTAGFLKKNGFHRG